LFDPRNYLRHYVEKGKEAASVAEIGVCIAEEVLGEEIFRHLWASKSQRTLRIQLPGATEEENHLAAALARVPWEMARAAADQSTLNERNLLVRVVHDRAAPATHDFAMSELALQLIRENKDKHTRGERAHSLNLDNWRLTGLPEEISDLVWLDYLSFIGTQVSDLSPLTGLANLQWLNISETQVSDLSPLAGLAYLQQLVASETHIVGEGGAGKTRLLRRLYQTKKPLPEEHETTKGIDIHRHEFPLPKGRTFRPNVWDFGGQEIYHATHQFFLTKRSLYVLLDDTRKDYKTVHDAGFKYWLEVVDVLSDHSPMLIFQNEKVAAERSSMSKA
jgi:hypothetical protein